MEDGNKPQGQPANIAQTIISDNIQDAQQRPDTPSAPQPFGQPPSPRNEILTHRIPHLNRIRIAGTATAISLSLILLFFSTLSHLRTAQPFSTLAATGLALSIGAYAIINLPPEVGQNSLSESERTKWSTANDLTALIGGSITIFASLICLGIDAVSQDFSEGHKYTVGLYTIFGLVTTFKPLQNHTQPTEPVNAPTHASKQTEHTSPGISSASSIRILLHEAAKIYSASQRLAQEQSRDDLNSIKVLSPTWQSSASRSRLYPLRPEYRILDRSNKRLLDQARSQGSRALWNLFMGITFALLAVVFLGYLVTSAPDPAQTALSTATRISGTLLLAALAFFFLRLYRASIDGVGYLHNEITNIESRIAAILLVSDTDSERDLAKILASTERNFRLGAGETTIDLEKAKIDARTIESTIKHLDELRNTIGLRSKN